jgi:hypothetical protein
MISLVTRPLNSLRRPLDSLIRHHPRDTLLLLFHHPRKYPLTSLLLYPKRMNTSAQKSNNNNKVRETGMTMRARVSNS